MERKISGVAAVLAVVAVFSLLFHVRGAIAKEADASVSITGIVTAAAYDEDGKVTDVVITAGDEVYEVADDGVKVELMQFIDSEITVEGEITEEEGIKTVKILEYRVQ